MAGPSSKNTTREAAKPKPTRDILDRLKVYEEYGPLSSVAIHPETPGYSTGMLLGDTRAARAEIERLREIEAAAKQWVDAVNADDRPNRNEAEDWMMRLLSHD